jgi:hypothetical protein
MLLHFITLVTLLLYGALGATPPAQRDALMDLYNSTGGGVNWTCGGNWASSTEEPCTWSGVTCDGDNVVGIVLVECGLYGTLPVGLTALSHLQYLELNFNSIFGTLPDWSGFDNLLAVGLANNSLTGALPASWSTFTSLQSVSLQYNELSGPLPASWGNFSKATLVQLSHNLLEGSVPEEWATLLANLDLSFNSLQGMLPAWSVNALLFDTGVSLDLSNNQLSGTLPEWDTFGEIVTLNLANNQLSGTIPDTWRQYPREIRQTLDLSNNQLSGSIGYWYVQTPRLFLQHNNFSGNLSFMVNLLQNAMVVDLSDNDFTGEIPDAMYPNWSCTYQSTCKCSLNLQNNYLEGSIPKGFCQLSSNINLNDNCLTSTQLPAHCNQNSPTCQIIAASQREQC